MKTTPPINRIIKRRKVLITSGTGGVGKTTLSAALAIQAALTGRRAVVITVDPAKRLATSLGMKTLGDEPLDLTGPLASAIHKTSGSPPSSLGRLAAVIPDHQKTLEHFIDSLAPSPALADRIKKNPIFEMISREFSGANEYMAIQRLHSLIQSGNYDTIVLDTPPNRNVLSILNAPGLLSKLFEDKAIRWVLGRTNSIFNRGIQKVLSALEFLTGAGFVRELFNFGQALFETQVNFTKTLEQIHAFFQSDQVGFLLVTTPSPDTASEFQYLVDQLHKKSIAFEAVVLNRTLGYFKISEDDQRKAAQHTACAQALNLVSALQAREKKVIHEIKTANQVPFLKIPEFSRDVHCLEDLVFLARILGDACGDACGDASRNTSGNTSRNTSSV